MGDVSYSVVYTVNQLSSFIISPNSQSPAGSSSVSSCVCNIGFQGPNGGECSACTAGKFKTSLGSVSCTDCGAGKYSTITGASTSATCVDCSAGKYSTNIGAPNSSTCANCGAGKYLVTTGQSSCANCGAGKFSDAVGASVASTCGDCGAGKYSAADARPSANTGGRGPHLCLCFLISRALVLVALAASVSTARSGRTLECAYDSREGAPAAEGAVPTVLLS